MHVSNFTRPGSSTLKLISRKGNTPVAAPDGCVGWCCVVRADLGTDEH